MDAPSSGSTPVSPAHLADPAVSLTGTSAGLDRAMLERVRMREPEALGRFFDAYFDRVYAVAFRLLRDREQAEDVAGDVFLKAHRAADRLDPGRDPLPWLVTIAANAARDVLRSGAERMRRHGTPVTEDGLADRLTSGVNDPEHDTLRREREAAVRDALETLPEDLKTSVLLYDYAGLSHEEIATRLGITHDAARKRHSRALAQMGRVLKERFR